ncbi:MAG: 2,3-bisphosphoglycerate-independent phosphoglycerate mutase [Oscillospiraceae bacterium]|jgi:2,3-bisphosphoglycerate-independent phosphoglycerate mutase
MKTPTTLIILDGYGLTSSKKGNAISAAKTPFLDHLFQTCPHCALSASGLDVGLPPGQMGNSEVGHTNIGAGRVVLQDLPRIHLAIEDGSFFQNPVFCAVMDACKTEGRALHLLGLLSDGGVHSHITHLWALLNMAKQRGVERVYIHGFLDGRDVSPVSGRGFVQDTLDMCKTIGVGQLATVMGRYYAMDRDNRWERVEKAYDAMVSGEGAVTDDPVSSMDALYQDGTTDEFIEPLICGGDGRIGPNDGVIFFNFRPDRAREITRALVDPDFSGFPRKNGFFPLTFACMTEYDATMPNVSVAFSRVPLDQIFGEYISQLGMTQLRIAETEKYAHVTFFFNGGQETVFPGEDRVLIPSPGVATYDLQPEMSAYEVAEEAASRIRGGAYDVIILNFANCDMVGHTGVFEAAVLAAEAVDACVKTVVTATSDRGGIAIVTADHGNAEQMQDAAGAPHTAHTTNPVPFLISGSSAHLREGGRLSDIVPTILDLMGLEKPEQMTGKTLITP